MSAGEACDDGGESATCNIDCTTAMCGDMVVNMAAGEACDDGAETATCDVDCTAVMCGDGTTNMTAGETCDDMGESMVCDTDCTTAMCGDGTTNVTAGEACDDMGESAACDPDCTTATCGDNYINATAGEECDDGNTMDGDGCSSVCTDEGPSVVITEMNIGVTDYVVLTNITASPVALGVYELFFDDSLSGDTTFSLPAMTLPAFASIHVIEASGALPGDISIPGVGIPFSPTRGGTTVLCFGACDPTNGANIEDAVSFSEGAAAPPLAPPVTFSPGGLILGIASNNQSALSYFRTDFMGSNPTFLASDWDVGFATRNPLPPLIITEVNIGSPDYVVLTNTTTGPVSLGSYDLFFDDSSAGDLAFPLPAMTLPAGASIHVIESGGALPGDISVSGNIPYSSTRGGTTLLCLGPCNPASGANVEDVHAFAEGAAEPPPPTGITFSPGGNVFMINEATESYLRSGYAGFNPSFFASDWVLGPASR